MSIITYPLDGVTYSAEDVATYLCTRTSGVYAKNSNFAASITGTRQVTIAPGLAWMNYDDFKGVSVCSRENTVLTVPDADNTLNRVDRIVLQFDAASNITAIRLKTGTPAVAAQPPAILQNHSQYELGLCTISVPAGSAAITAADVTDTRADETVCGVMRDGVTGIPTQQLLAEARARIGQLEETASTSAAAADKSAKAAAASQSAAAGSASTANTNAAAAASSASTAQSAASTATKQATTATEQATAAASSASAAKTSESNAKTSETAAVDHLQATKEYFEQVRTITIGAQGWYATPEALKAAVPVGENGWWAVVGTTDTIWTWDGDTGAWVDTCKEVDLSDYLTQDQIRKLLEQYMPLRPATATTLGGVKVGSGLTVDADGTLSAGSALAAYPVGSIYQSTDAASPAALFGGTWEQIASNRVLMGTTDSSKAGFTVEAGLPNIVFNLNDNYFGESPTGTGGVSVSVRGSTNLRSGGNMPAAYGNVSFDASGSSSIYGNSRTVQPPAYYVYIWRRVA